MGNHFALGLLIYIYWHFFPMPQILYCIFGQHVYNMFLCHFWSWHIHSYMIHSYYCVTHNIQKQLRFWENNLFGKIGSIWRKLKIQKVWLSHHYILISLRSDSNLPFFFRSFPKYFIKEFPRILLQEEIAWGNTIFQRLLSFNIETK